jgi:hypothetical protein
VAAAVAYVKALKLVPPGLASWLGRGLMSANPEEVARAAEVYAAIAGAAPRQLPEGAGNQQSLYAMTIAALRRQGYAPADAVRVAGERVLRSNRDSQGFLARNYDADRPAIEAGTARFLAGAGVALGAEGRARFDAMVREAYGRTGEIDAARAVALMLWKRGEGERVRAVPGESQIVFASDEDSSRSGRSLSVEGTSGSSNPLDVLQAFVQRDVLPPLAPNKGGQEPRFRVGRYTYTRTMLDLFRRAATATVENRAEIREVIRTSGLTPDQRTALYSVLEGGVRGLFRREGKWSEDRSLDWTPDRLLFLSEGLADQQRLDAEIWRGIANSIGGLPSEAASGALGAARRVFRGARSRIGLRSLVKTRVERLSEVREAKPNELPPVSEPRTPKGTPDSPFVLPSSSIVDQSKILTKTEFLSTHKNIGMIDPNRIGTTQQSISSFIRLKNGVTVPLTRYVEALKSGELDPRTIEPIAIYVKDGRIVTSDHRRLVAARLAGVKVRFRLATADEIRRSAIQKIDPDLPINQIYIRR